MPLTGLAVTRLLPVHGSVGHEPRPPQEDSRLFKEMTMDMPEYYLTRPSTWTDADVSGFERLYADQVEPGAGTEIDYRLDAPRWQFLSWLTDEKGLLLHGSGKDDITEFEPRHPEDTSEFGGQQAVFASSDGIWAMFFAIVDREVARSLVNASFVLGTRETATAYYYFSINQDAFDNEPWTMGMVYVLPAHGFRREPDDEWHGRRLRANQWASSVPVKPLAKLRVSPDDFPFLAEVNGHHQPSVVARAAEDPDGFPWRA
jgi:hypothetical protein